MSRTTPHSAFRVMVFLVLSTSVSFSGVGAQSSSAARYHLDVSQSSGAPGAWITVTASDLGPGQSYRMAVGALRFGFEEVGWVMADSLGNLTTEVEVPDWGLNDVVHRFILNDLYQKPVGFSGVFHVTNAAGEVRREGTIATVDGFGLVLVGVEGITYALVGDLEGLVEGSDVFVEGPVIDPCGCDDMITIRVRRVTANE